MSPSRPVSRVFGEYELGPPLGKGGQGEVFRALDLRTKERVALKLFRLGRDEDVMNDLRRRVVREAVVLQKILHPGIVRALGHGEIDQEDPANAGYLYIAYELIDGSDLSEAMSKPVPPEADDVVALLRGLSSALSEAHRHDLVHRDIKPSNVRLRSDSWSDPVLVDFGCVHVDGSSSLTPSVGAIGTLSYMAPEMRHSAKNATAGSDQWALARLASEAIAVALNQSYEDVRSMGAEDLVAALIAPRLPTVAVCLRQALSKDPQRRYRSVQQCCDRVIQASAVDEWFDGGLEIDENHDQAVALQDDEKLVDYFARHSLPVVDKRGAKGGNLWVIATREQFSPHLEEMRRQKVKFYFAPNGGRASRGEPAWYTASPN